MAIFETYDLAPFDETDPDDFRPKSRWARLVDRSVGSGAEVDDITVIIEEIASAIGSRFTCIPATR